MENCTINYKSYTIHTQTLNKRGLFFRNPRQKIYYDVWYDAKNMGKYLDKIKNPFRRLYETLLGNKEAVRNLEKWMNELDFGGCIIYAIRCPIYFKRCTRTLTAIDTSNRYNISKIQSSGYESEFNYCAGDCEVERTKIKLKSGKTMRIVNKGKFHYTYRHIVDQIIDSQQTGGTEK